MRPSNARGPSVRASLFRVLYYSTASRPSQGQNGLPRYGQVAAIIFIEFTLRYAIPTVSPFVVDLLRVS